MLERCRQCRSRGMLHEVQDYVLRTLTDADLLTQHGIAAFDNTAPRVRTETPWILRMVLVSALCFILGVAAFIFFALYDHIYAIDGSGVL